MIKFIYQNCQHKPYNEKISINLINKLRLLLPLPENIIIEFVNLDPSIYAETIVDRKTKNTIRLNNILEKKELIQPLLHELIHLNQIYTGRLSVYRNGSYCWEGKMFTVDTKKLSYNDYNNLPWEQDVIEREQKLLQQILK
jgi:hypothetical protein